MYQEDTIVAIASAVGGTPRGVVRVAGPDMPKTVASVFEPDQQQQLQMTEAARVVSGAMLLAEPLGRVPCDLYIWPTDRSYTRQPAAELHTIGSQPILNAAVGSLCSAGARLAQPGEFTMRAFLAGRLDLTQAEAVLGVIDSQSQRDLDVALRQLAGGLSKPLQILRRELIELLAHLEAGLDFVEEEIEFISVDELTAQLHNAEASVDAILAMLASRGTSADERRVALVGLPNVGKSSLLNALVGDEAAIVSDTAGTTRDYVTRQTTFGALPVTFVDTAGVEEADVTQVIAAESQVIAKRQQREAALVLLCLDSTRSLLDWENHQLDTLDESARIVVHTKADVRTGRTLVPNAVRTSSVTGEGIDDLRKAIHGKLIEQGQPVASTAARCLDSLRQAAASLAHAKEVAASAVGEEFVAVDVRVALDELGKVVGAVYTDDILDRIFSRFCIGK